MDTKDKIDTSKIMLDDILNSMPEETKTGDTEQTSDEIIQVNDVSEEINEDFSSIDEPIDVDSLINEDVNTKPAFELEDYDDLDTEVSDKDDLVEDEDYRRKETEKPKKKKRRKSHGGGLLFGFLLTIFIISVAVLCAVTIIKYSKEFMGIDKSDVAVTIEIPEGVGTAEIAELLKNEGIIDEIELFLLFSRIKGTDSSYYSGTHVFTANMSYGDIVDELSTQIEIARETANVTFPEGITILDAAKKLEEKGICDASEFVTVFNSASYGFDFEEKVKRNPLKFYKMEGYLFPDTYTFYLDEDPRVVAKKIYKNFEARITPDLYGRMNNLGMELEEVLTLASIVQAEAAYKSDMKRVASVFLNRLNNADEFPLLQSDPTTKYVNEVIKPNLEINSKAMFEAYDTYKGAGLTPGPICNPGLEAINAVLYPAETDYFYFCSNIDTGEFFYAKTNAEHEANLVEAGLW